MYTLEQIIDFYYLDPKEDADEIREMESQTDLRQYFLNRLQAEVEEGFKKALDKDDDGVTLQWHRVYSINQVLEEGLHNFDPWNSKEYGLPLFKATAVKYGWNNPIGDDRGDESKYSSEQ
jgi:DNA polymerase elongation subunit (family B)